MSENNIKQALDNQIPNRFIQNYCDTEKPFKHFQQVYKEDAGKGYKVVDILSNLGYLVILIFFLFSLWSAIHNLIILVGLLVFPFYVLLIYLMRLVFRTIFAWRDKIADEILE